MAGATRAGLKNNQEKYPDLAILATTKPCYGAALFTNNRIKAAPVLLSRQRTPSHNLRGVVVNSGIANACTGETGLKDAAEMAELAASNLGVAPDSILVASTGVIGEPLPMGIIREGIRKIEVSRYGGHDMARAIMTTDTVPKEAAVIVNNGQGHYTIGGVAKGSGMVHPNLATFLGFITTDAPLSPELIDTALRNAAGISFNMLSIDGDTSTNDMLLIMASGLASDTDTIYPDTNQARTFEDALNQLCISLARKLARDGEGAEQLIEVKVGGSSSPEDARLIARTIVSSPLVKAAIHGKDPNWGRIIAAAGRSGVVITEPKIDLFVGEIQLVKSGCPVPYDRNLLLDIMSRDEVVIDLELNTGDAAATAWGCDLTEKYVEINSKYTT